MPQAQADQVIEISALDDSELVLLARQRHPAAFAAIMQQYDRRLCRVVSGVDALRQVWVGRLRSG